ncbi:unnamed protein product [Effrenium voratum]|nr:unnamed protein product [Effrenium voratum]
MITLVQFVTLDSMANMYKPLVKADWRLAFYFIGMVLAISIVLMNLITAVIVNSALEQASNNKEIQRVQENKRRKKTIEELRNMFSRLDHDGSGTITLAEIMEATEEDQIMLKKFLTLDSPLEIFCMLDIDNSGQLNIEEFCEGVMEHVTSDRSVEFKRIDKNFKQLRKEVRELQLSVDKVASIALKASGSGTGSQQLSPVALTKKKRDVKFNEENDQNEMPRDSEPVTEPEPPEPQQPTAEPASESPLWATDMMNLLREELAHEFWQVRSDLARGMAVAAQQAAAYAQERPLDLLSELNQEVSKLKLPWPPRQCESARQIERDRGKPSWQWPEGKTPHVAVAGSKWSSAIPSRSAPAMPPAPAPDNDSPRLDVGPWS